MTGSDHKDAQGNTYEQKSYDDPQLYPQSEDKFRCSASSTHPANNDGPVIKRMLESGDYASALDLCKRTGYDKNDFYVFTNTGHFKPIIPLRFFIIPTDKLLKVLDLEDPRLVSKSVLLGMLQTKIVLA